MNDEIRMGSQDIMGGSYVRSHLSLAGSKKGLGLLSIAIVVCMVVAGLGAAVARGGSPGPLPGGAPVSPRYAACNDCVVGSVTVGAGPYGVVYDNVSGAVYAVDESSGDVSRIDTSNNTVVASIPVGGGPWTAAVDTATGNLYVPNSLSNSVSVVSGSSNSVLSTIALTSSPFAAAYDPSNGNIYVTTANSVTYAGNVTVLSASSGTVVTSIPVGKLPQGIAYDSANGDFYVANRYSDTVSVVSGSTDTVVATLPVGTQPLLVAYDASNGNVYASNWGSANVSVISGATNQVTGTAATGTNPTGIAYSPVTGQVLVANYNGGGAGSVSVINSSDNAVLTTIGVGNGPQDIAYDAATGFFYLAISGNDSVSILDATGSQSFPLAVSMTESPSSGVIPLSVSFSATATGGTSPYTFSWLFGDGTGATGPNAQHTYDTAGTYAVTVTGQDAAGKTASSSATVVAYAPPSGNQTGAIELAITANPVTGDAPLSTHFEASASGGTPPYTFNWSFGDGGNWVLGPSVFHTFVNPGEYVATVVATDSVGNEATTGVFVTVNGSGAPAPAMVATVTALVMHGMAPLAVTFTPEVVGGSAPYQLTWNFGDGSSATGGLAPVTHTYQKAGTFTPQLTVKDASGSSDTWSAGSSGIQHPIVVTASVTQGPPATSFPLEWILLAFVVAVVVGVGVMAMTAQRKRRPPVDSSHTPRGTPPVAPYPTAGSGEPTFPEAPVRPVPPAPPTDPLRDAL